MKHLSLVLLTFLLATNAFAYTSQSDCEAYEGAGACSPCGGGWHRNSACSISALAYNGTLSSNSVAVNVPHDFVLHLHGGPVGGVPIAVSSTNLSLAVTNGQFTALVDTWGSDDLSRTNLHVEVALRRSGSGAPFVTLLPRQRLASVPRAAVAERALTIPASALSVANLGTNTVDGAFIGVGSVGGFQIGPSQVVKSFNGLMDGVNLVAGPGLLLSAGTNNTLTVSKSNNVFNCSDYDQCYWTLLGNTGTTPPGPQTEFPALTDNWVGTTDRTALELRVNTWRGLRLQPYLPSPVDPINRTVSVIGGYSQNVVDPGVYAATIAGGSSQTGFNTVNGSYGTVGGGSGNTAGTFPGGAYATVAGGANNLASGYISFVAGGNRNSATSKFAAVGGGASNVAEAVFATVAGGLRNTNSGYAAIIGGGDTNRIQANSDSATISGGQWNLIQNAAPFATIGGGRVNKASANAATIGGGAFNTNSGSSSTISGGDFNVIPSGAAFTTVAGGHLNFASGSSATVGGGSFNKAVAPNSTIPGGQQALTGSYGQQAYASGQFANPGDAQSSLLVLRTNTSSTAQSELFLDGGTAGNQRMNVPIGATWTFNILVAARNGAAGGNQSGGWEIRGVVQNIGGTVSLLCSTITTNCATLAGTPFVQALNPQQALVINTKDQTAAPTRWVASVRTAEVIAP